MIRRSVATFALVLAAAGCDSAPPPVALEQFSTAAMDAVCDWAVGCRNMPDAATCRRFLDPKQYDTRRAEDAVAAGRMSYDPAAGGACIAATAAAGCAATPFSDPSCGRLFTGLVVEGDACTSDYECAGGAACEDAVCQVQCCLGRCGPPVDPPESPSLAAVGEPCQSHGDCRVGAYCETDGRCAAMPDQPGQRCLIGCARGDLYCDVDLLSCREFAGLDQPCDATGATAPPCAPAWSFCDRVCRPRPGAGEPCDDQRLCVPTTWCANGACQARGGPGDACVESDQCDVVCDSGAGQCAAYASCPDR